MENAGLAMPSFLPVISLTLVFHLIDNRVEFQLTYLSDNLDVYILLFDNKLLADVKK